MINLLTGKRKYILKLIISSMIIMLAAGIVLTCRVTDAYASENGAYELVKYEKTVQVYSSHMYDNRVKITVNLPRKMSEIDFNLPSGKFQVSEVTVENKNVEYEVKSISDERTIKLTSTDKFKKGEHVFIINYRISEYSERNEEYDLFYYNVLLPKWKTPMGELNIKLQFPEDFPMSAIETYAGKFGVQDNTGKVKFVVNDRSNTVTISGVRIPENYAITLKAELPDGYWRGALDHSWALYVCCGIIILAVLAGFVLWLIGGRDPKVERVVQKKPLAEINPVEIGYILEGKFKIRDLSSLIIYMGTKGYLRISEYEPKKYRLVKCNEPKEEPRYIRALYKILFDNVYENRGIEIEKLGRRLNAMYKSAELGVSSGFNDEDMSAKTEISRIFRIISAIVLAAAVAAIAVFRAIYNYQSIPVIETLIVFIAELSILTWATMLYDRRYEISRGKYRLFFSIGMLLSMGIVGDELYQFAKLSGEYIVLGSALLVTLLGMLIVVYMSARGKKNAELAGRLASLRRFMYSAKPNDVDALYFEDNDYYYDMMPYACSFSAIETWAQTFKWLRVLPPEWFSNDIVGHAETNNSSGVTYDFAKDIKIFTRTFEDYYNKTARYYITEKKRSRFKGE